MDAAESEMEEVDADSNGRPGDDTKVAHFCVIGPGRTEPRGDDDEELVAHDEGDEPEANESTKAEVLRQAAANTKRKHKTHAEEAELKKLRTLAAHREHSDPGR